MTHNVFSGTFFTLNPTESIVLRCGLQYCRSKKVRSSKHSGVEYWYSKCTPISGAREYHINDVEDERASLEDLINYIDHEQSLVDTVQTDFDERSNTMDNDLQEPAADKMEDNIQEPVEKADADDDGGLVDGEENAVFRDWGTASNGFQEIQEATGDVDQELTEKEFEVENEEEEEPEIMI